ncbi:MAG: hypothetical protein ACOY3I_06075 [Verrucomicrobiota bacterium]
MTRERSKSGKSKVTTALTPGRFVSKHRNSNLGPEFELSVPTYVEGVETHSIVKEFTNGTPEELAPFFYMSSGVPHKGILTEIRGKRKGAVEKDGVEILSGEALLEVTIMGGEWERCPATRRKSFAYAFHLGGDKPVLSIERLGAPYDMQQLFAKQLPGVSKICQKLGIKRMYCDAFSAYSGGLPRQQDWNQMRERMSKRLDYLERYLPNSVVSRLRNHLQSSNPKALWDVVDENLEMPSKAIDGDYSLCRTKEIRGLPSHYAGVYKEFSGTDATGKMTVGLDLLNSAVEIHVDDMSHPFHFKETTSTWPTLRINLNDPKVMERMENYAKNWGVAARGLTEGEKDELLTKLRKESYDITQHQEERKAKGLYAFSREDLHDTMIKFKGTPQEWDEFVRMSPQDTQALLTRGLDVEKEGDRGEFGWRTTSVLKIDLEKEGKQKLKGDLCLPPYAEYRPEVKFLERGNILEIDDPMTWGAGSLAEARRIKKQWFLNLIDYSLQTGRKAIHFPNLGNSSFWPKELAQMGLVHSPDIWKRLHAEASKKLTFENVSKWGNWTPEMAKRYVEKVQSLNPDEPKDFWKLGIVEEADIVPIEGARDGRGYMGDLLIEHHFSAFRWDSVPFILDLSSDEAVQKAREFLQKPEDEAVLAIDRERQKQASEIEQE